MMNRHRKREREEEKREMKMKKKTKIKPRERVRRNIEIRDKSDNPHEKDATKRLKKKVIKTLKKDSIEQK